MESGINSRRNSEKKKPPTYSWEATNRSKTYVAILHEKIKMVNWWYLIVASSIPIGILHFCLNISANMYIVYYFLMNLKNVFVNLQLSNYNSFDGVLYCRPHFDQIFKRTGSLEKSFEGNNNNESCNLQLSWSDLTICLSFSRNTKNLETWKACWAQRGTLLKTI